MCKPIKSKEPEKKYRAAIITASDKGSAGKREDLSGPEVEKWLLQAGYEIVSKKILPDEEEEIYQELVRIADENLAEVIFTTGGTGLSPRDNTPEATLRAATKNVPGIAEALRYYSLQITGRTMLSRAVSVMRGRTLIINLPGSPKAVAECMEYLLPQLTHGIGIMVGDQGECGSNC